MKIIQISSLLLSITIAFSLYGRGGGCFGGAFAGSLVGGFAGSAIGNAATQPRQSQTIVYERTTPVYVERPVVEVVRSRKKNKKYREDSPTSSPAHHSSENSLLLKAQLESAQAREREATARAETAEAKNDNLKLQLENEKLKRQALKSAAD